MRALNDSNRAIDDFGAGGGRSSCYDVVRSCGAPRRLPRGAVVRAREIRLSAWSMAHC